jgi:O-antigen/teichoic acid export membrane protein
MAFSFHQYKLLIWTYTTRALTLLVNLLQLKLLVHFWSQKEFGIWGEIGIALLFLVTFCSMCFGQSIIRLTAAISDEIRKKYLITATIAQSTLLLTVFVVTCPFYSTFTRIITGGESFEIFGLIFLVVFAQINHGLLSSFFTAKGKFIFIMTIDTISNIMLTFLIILFAWLLKSYRGALYGMLAANAGVLVYLWYQAKFQRSDFAFSKKYLHELIAYGIPSLGIAIMTWGILSGNRHFLSHFKNFETLAQYNVTAYVSLIASTLFLSISSIFLTRLSALYENDQIDKVKYWLSLSIRVVLVLGILAGVMIICFGKYLILLLANRQYLSPDIPLILAFQVLQVLLYLFFIQCNKFFELQKRLKELFAYWMIAAISSALLCWFLIPVFSIPGLLFANCVGYLISLSLSLSKAWKLIGLERKTLFITAGILLVTFPAAIWCGNLASEQTFPVFLISAISVIVVTSVLLFYSKILKINEVIDTSSIWKKFCLLIGKN